MRLLSKTIVGLIFCGLVVITSFQLATAFPNLIQDSNSSQVLPENNTNSSPGMDGFFGAHGSYDATTIATSSTVDRIMSGIYTGDSTFTIYPLYAVRPSALNTKTQAVYPISGTNCILPDWSGYDFYGSADDLIYSPYMATTGCYAKTKGVGLNYALDAAYSTGGYAGYPALSPDSHSGYGMQYDLTYSQDTIGGVPMYSYYQTDCIDKVPWNGHSVFDHYYRVGFAPQMNDWAAGRYKWTWHLYMGAWSSSDTLRIREYLSLGNVEWWGHVRTVSSMYMTADLYNVGTGNYDSYYNSGSYSGSVDYTLTILTVNTYPLVYADANTPTFKYYDVTFTFDYTKDWNGALHTSVTNNQMYAQLHFHSDITTNDLYSIETSDYIPAVDYTYMTCEYFGDTATHSSQPSSMGDYTYRPYFVRLQDSLSTQYLGTNTKYTNWTTSAKNYGTANAFQFVGINDIATKFDVYTFNLRNQTGSPYYSRYYFSGSTPGFHPSISQVLLNDIPINLFNTYGTCIIGQSQIGLGGHRLDQDSHYILQGYPQATFGFTIPVVSTAGFTHLNYSYQVNYADFDVPNNIPYTSGGGTKNFNFYPLIFDQAVTFDDYHTDGQPLIVSMSLNGGPSSAPTTIFDSITPNDLPLYDCSRVIGISWNAGENIALTLSITTDNNIPIISNPQLPSGIYLDTDILNFHVEFSDTTTKVASSAIAWEDNFANRFAMEMELDNPTNPTYAELSIPASTIGSGQWRLWYIVNDAAGNWRSSSYSIIQINIVAPLVECLNESVMTVQNGTGNHEVKFRITTTAIGKYNITINGEINQDGDLSPGVNEETILVPSDVFGSFSINCSANKTTGEYSWFNVTLNVVHTPEFIQIPTNLSVIEDTGIYPIFWTIKDENPSSYAIYRNGLLDSSGTLIQEEVYTILLDSGWVDGSYIYRIVITDLQGYWNETHLNFTINAEYPLVTIQEDFEIYQNSTDVLLDFVCLDNTLSTYSLKWNTTDEFGRYYWKVLISGTFSSSEETIILRLDNLLPIGEQVLNFTVSDSRGHESSQIFVVTVLENPPAISLNISGLVVWIALILVCTGLTLGASRSRGEIWTNKKKKRWLIIGVWGGLAIALVILAFAGISPFYSYKFSDLLGQFNETLGDYGPLVLVGGVAVIFVVGFFGIRALLRRKRLR